MPSLCTVRPLLYVHHPRLGGWYPKMVPLLDPWDLPEHGEEEGRPVERRNHSTAVSLHYQLSLVALGRTLYYLCDGLEASNRCSSVEAFEQAKTPVWSELGVANYQERHGDVGVPLGDGPPEEIVDHGVVLVLPSAVVGVEVDILLTYSER